MLVTAYNQYSLLMNVGLHGQIRMDPLLYRSVGCEAEKNDL